ncbi:MAG: hypothetical protein DRR06_01620 [Gammaproteobacteria bacterium]|nr:MAG: hypothetical protein DRR06_01620 [Gammaproteobacteria bacterium]
MPLSEQSNLSYIQLVMYSVVVFLLAGQYPASVLAEAETEAALAANTHNEWVCKADADNNWQCTEITVPGPAFNKPPHRAPTLTASAAPSDETRIQVARNLDWVDERALPEAQKDAISPGCCGAYIEPPRDYPDGELDPEQAALSASATNTEARDNVATMTGDVQISQGYRQVSSDTASVDQNNRTAEMKGNVQFREPGLLMLGDRAQVNLDTQEIEIENATYVMHEPAIRGSAGLLKRDVDDHIYIDNAAYTTCEPGNNTWRLVSPHIDINPDTGLATARHVRIEIKDIPVFYTPWLRYPIDGRRVTGLLFPEVGYSKQNGFDYAQPIYLNLAPNYDATITPRYLDKRGEMLEAEFRHLSRVTDLVMGGAYLPDDDGGKDQDEDDSGAIVGEDRWLANIDQHGGMGQAWRTRIDYTKVSDDDYFRDLGNGTLQATSQTHLRQLAAAGYYFKNWQVGVQAVEYQTLIRNEDNQYKQLPRVDADGNYLFSPWDLDLELDLDHQYTEFDHDDSNITGTRLRADYGLTLNKQWMWGYVRPTAKIKNLYYDLDNPVLVDGDEDPSITVPVGIVDAGLFFERDTTLLTNLVQTFEPRLYYLYSRHEDQIDNPDFDTAYLTFSYQQLFRDDRFSGSDRIGDANQVSVGLTSRLIDANTGVEKLRGSIGQIYYFKDRYVSLDPTLSEDFLDNMDVTDSQPTQEQRDIADDLASDESNIAGELAAQLSQYWRFQSDILFDHDDDKIDKGNVSLRYNNARNAIFNATYRYTRENPDLAYEEEDREYNADIEQADISTMLPLNNSWSLIGRWNHDITNSRELEIFGGIEYNSCCWRGSVIVRRWLERDDDLVRPEDDLDYDEGIFFQVQLKGLAGTGSKVESILSDGIYGYVPQDP